MARLSDKQHAYLHGPKPVRALQIIPVKKGGAASCADCRRAECLKKGEGWQYVCTLSLQSSPRQCEHFRDARKPSREFLLQQ